MDRFCLLTVPDVVAARTCGGLICFGLFLNRFCILLVFVLDSSTRFNSVVCPLCYWWNTNNAALKNGKYTWNGQKWIYRVILISRGNIDFSMRALILSVRPIKVIVNQLVSVVLQVLLDQLPGHLSKILNRSLSDKHDWFLFFSANMHIFLLFTVTFPLSEFL